MFDLEKHWEQPDWPFLADGAVNLFRRKDLYREAQFTLRNLEYNLIDIPFEEFGDFCSKLGAALKWKDQFGYEPWTGNLNAFNDGLRTFPFPASKCVAICIEGFHRFVDQHEKIAHGILDVIEYQSRNHLLFGHKLVTLIQTDDGDFESTELGARRANWNDAEWMMDARRLE
jgi:hypothetical protein